MLSISTDELSEADCHPTRVYRCRVVTKDPILEAAIRRIGRHNGSGRAHIIPTYIGRTPLDPYSYLYPDIR